MLKKDIPIEAVEKNKCGDCMHFKRVAKFEKVCSQLAVKHYANAPNCFMPDLWKLTELDPKTLYQLGLMFNKADISTMRILTASLKMFPRIRKRYALAFGQPVYFRFGSDYLSNYYRGFVAGAALAGDDQVFVSSNMERSQRKQPMMAQLMRSSVFTNTEFVKQKAALIKANKIMDPKPLFTPVPKIKGDPVDYVPPSMETAPSEWYDKVSKRPKMKSRIRTTITGDMTFKVQR